jgi:hypothetical protein
MPCCEPLSRAGVVAPLALMHITSNKTMRKSFAIRTDHPTRPTSLRFDSRDDTFKVLESGTIGDPIVDHESDSMDNSFT